MRPSILGCLGTLVVSYLLLALAVIYLGVAVGTVAVLAFGLFVVGAGANLLLRTFLGILLSQTADQGVKAGRLSLVIVLSAPFGFLLGTWPLTLGDQTLSATSPIIVWMAVLVVSLPSYYWMYFANEIPWVHWKVRLPFAIEKAMRKEEKAILGWLGWFFRAGEAEPDDEGNLTLGIGVQTSAALPRRNFVLNPQSRTTHTYVIGQPGTGKSRALESWIMQDIKAGHGAGVIDPHGELFNHLLFRIAQLTEEQPELAERVVIINPLDPDWTVGFNPLEAVRGVPSERLALFMTDVVVKIWHIETNEAPRMTRLLTFTFLALAELGLTLADLPRFLTDEGWRAELLLRANSPEVIGYFRFEFPKAPGAVQQWTNPVLNKVGALLFDHDLRLIFSTKSTINFRDILDRGLVLLVNLSKGHLAEGNSALLGAFIVAHLQKAALARTEELARSHPFYLYLDEFQNYTTDNIQDILSESRKYGMPLVLAHQHFSQLSTNLLEAALSDSGTFACFRVSYQDASVLSNDIFPPGYLESSWGEFKFRHFGRALLPLPREERETLSHRELASLLTQLSDREFWVKQRGPYLPSKQRTFEMPDPVKSDELFKLRAQVLRTAGQKYGRIKAEVTKELEDEREQLLKRYGGKIPSLTDYEKT